MEDDTLQVINFINTTTSHIFLTGKAGTGKTTFLKNLGSYTHKSYIVVAPTGIAALNAGGVTIHSQFLLPPTAFLPDRFLPENYTGNEKILNQNILARKHPLNSTRKKVLRSIDLLVIDEVSMLRADLLDAIDYRMKAARGNFKESFGGIQVLFIGDLFQLPPVIQNEEQHILKRFYKSSWFYEAKALQNNPPVYIELDKVFRQHDSEFIDILNNLRNNTVTPHDLEILNQRHRSIDEINTLKEIITLTTHNYKADQLNQKELRDLTTPSHIFDAIVEGEFPESMYPVPVRLELKEGAQIMFTRNDTSEYKKYVNGKLATVKKIDDEIISVILAETHEEYVLKRECWENKRYLVNTESQEMEEETIGSFEQYPIKLAWAITVHKSQGLTFDKAIIDVGEAFTGGQVYVALSRLRSLNGLYLRTHIHPSVISTDKQILEYTLENHRPEKLTEVIQKKQKKYLENLVKNTFDFSGLIKEINYVQRENTEQEIVIDKAMKSPLVQVVETLRTEKINTEKFQIQLVDLLNTNQHQALLNRIAKGRTYYRIFLIGIIKQLLQHIEAIRYQKRVKTYMNHLLELDQLFNRKLEEIDNALLLVEGITQGHTKFDFDSLSKKRIEERTAILKEIQNEEQKLISATPQFINKKKKKEENGINTYERTLQLFKQGMAVREIAKQRELVESTIETHLIKAIEKKQIEISELLNTDEIETITQAIKELPQPFTSKDLYDKLQGNYSYGKLRATIAHINNNQI